MESKQRTTIRFDKVLVAIGRLMEAGQPATVAALASALALSESTVQRKLAQLERQHRVASVPGPGRKRSYRILSTTQAAASPQPEPSPPAQGAAPAINAGTGGQVRAPPPSPPPPPGPPGASSGDVPLPGPPGPDATPQARPSANDFEPKDLDRMVISLPLQLLLQRWQQAKADKLPSDHERFAQVENRTRVFQGRFSVIIDLNTEYLGGVQAARQRVLDLLVLLAARDDFPRGGSLLSEVAPRDFRDLSNQYVVARLWPEQITELVRLDHAAGAEFKDYSKSRARRAIFRIWPDNVVERQNGFTSLPTIKVDAARNSFGCTGRGIVWAVIDSGIDRDHAHFTAHRNLLELPPNVTHMDFANTAQPEPLVDNLGHGTHVAGIIAGEIDGKDDRHPVAVIFERDEGGGRSPSEVPLDAASGVAPQCKLVSYKVLDGDGRGGVTEIMASLEHIHRVNGYGKSIVIHGVNMSLGYRYDPQWFACGHSPLCEVVDRVARSGVCVVVAAGNSGYGEMDTLLAGARAQGMPLSINDPGNAERAITVGSTHRDAPHTYGVSYFSSKGPTGDGRAKPDLLAPGEKIISCLSTGKKSPPPCNAQPPLRYVEDSGTSMAAPHVSGAIAALLSVRREFIGRCDDIKRVLMSSALDLGRERSMQGSGLLNLFSALQSI